MRMLKLFMILVVAIWGTGCVTSTINMSPAITQTATPPQNTGVVVVRVINAGSIPLPLNYITLAPDNMNESAEIKAERLEWLYDKTASEAIFAAYVPAGNYSIASLRSFHTLGDRWFDRWVQAGLELGTFKVMNGEVTDLGSLVYYPRVMEDRYADSILRTPNSETLSLIKQLSPYAVPFEKESFTWTEDDLQESRHTEYASAIQNPVVYTSQHIDAQNNIYLASKLGVLLTRKPAGEWELEALESDSDINAIASNDLGDIAFGGDYGRLSVKSRTGEWRQFETGIDNTIEDVLFSSNTEIDLVIRRDREVAILRGDISQQEVSWNKVVSYTSTMGWRNANNGLICKNRWMARPSNVRRIASISVQEVDGKHYISIASQTGNRSSIISPSVTEVFEFDPKHWSVMESKGFGASVDRVLAAGETYLGLNEPGLFSFRLRDIYMRYNLKTKEWEKMATSFDNCPEAPSGSNYCKIDGSQKVRFTDFNYISIPNFFTGEEAVVFASYQELGKDSRTVELIETKDGGRSWVKTGRQSPSEYCARLLPGVGDALIVTCAGISSDIYESYDRGETWEHVREHESF